MRPVQQRPRCGDLPQRRPASDEDEPIGPRIPTFAQGRKDLTSLQWERAKKGLARIADRRAVRGGLTEHQDQAIHPPVDLLALAAAGLSLDFTHPRPRLETDTAAGRDRSRIERPQIIRSDGHFQPPGERRSHVRLKPVQHLELAGVANRRSGREEIGPKHEPHGSGVPGEMADTDIRRQTPLETADRGLVTADYPGHDLLAQAALDSRAAQLFHQLAADPRRAAIRLVDASERCGHPRILTATRLPAA